MHRAPNSAGTAPPRLAVPAHACDSHMHVFDRRFAFSGTEREIALIRRKLPLSPAASSVYLLAKKALKNGGRAADG